MYRFYERSLIGVSDGNEVFEGQVNSAAVFALRTKKRMFEQFREWGSF